MVVQKRPSPFRNVETGPIVTSGRIRELASYWEAKRAGRAMPVKREIDPAEIKSLLPYLMIAELHRGDTLRIRYRLVGTEAARYAEEDYTNLWLDESGWQQWESRPISISIAALPPNGARSWEPATRCGRTTRSSRSSGRSSRFPTGLPTRLPSFSASRICCRLKRGEPAGRLRGLRSGSRGRSEIGKAHRHRRTDAFRALDFDVAAKELGELARERQADAGSFVSAA